jgi:hypothetical protein
LVIALVVLVGLLVVADFAAAAIFEHEVSKRARSQLGLADDPSVRVHGFSFLLQALSGTYDHVTVDAKGVPVKDTLRDVEVKADLYGVQAPLGDLISGNAQAVSVDKVDGVVIIKASDVSRALAKNENSQIKAITQVSIDPISELEATSAKPLTAAELPKNHKDPEDTKAGARICGTIDIAGQSTDICAYGLVELTGKSIGFAPKRIQIRNALTSATLPPSIQSAVAKVLTFTQDPGALPFKVTPTEVNVEPGELSVRGTAEHVKLTGVAG